MKISRSLFAFVVFATLVSGLTIQAKLPPLLEVPDYLPADVKMDLVNQRANLEQRHASLLQWADRFNTQWKAYLNIELTNNTDPMVRQCLDEKTKLVNAGQDYARDADAFNKAVGEDISNLDIPQTIAKFEAQISLDEAAIRNLGFEKRASEFAEWEAFSTNTQQEFENKTVQIVLKLAVDEAAAVSATAGEDKLASLRQKDANELIKALREKGMNDPNFFEALRNFSSANNSKARVAALKILTAVTTQVTQAAVNTTTPIRDNSLLTATTEAFVEAVETIHSPQYRLLVGEVELTSAVVYDSAAQNVSKARIHQMTEMTEDQLKALDHLTDKLQKHVKALNDLKKQATSSDAAKPSI